MKKFIAIFGLGILLITACTTQKEPSESNNENSSIDSASELFDDCPGLEGYKEKDFYKNLIADLKIEDKYAPSYMLLSPEKDDYVSPFGVENACYSEKTGRVLMVLIPADMGNVPVFVIDYDINTRKEVRSNTITAMASNYYFTKQLGETFELRGDCSACAWIKETVLSYNLRTGTLTKVEEVKKDPPSPELNLPATS